MPSLRKAIRDSIKDAENAGYIFQEVETDMSAGKATIHFTKPCGGNYGMKISWQQ